MSYYVREQLISCIDNFVRNPSTKNKEGLVALLNEPKNQNIVQDIVVDLFAKQKEISQKYNDLKDDYEDIKEDHDKLEKEAQKERRFSCYRATIIDCYMNTDGDTRIVTTMGGLKEDMSIGPNVKHTDIIIGNEAVIVSVNGTKTTIGVKEPTPFDGSICKVTKIIDTHRLLAARFNGGEEMPGFLRAGLTMDSIKIGDNVRIDLASRVVYEVFENKPEASRFNLVGNASNTFDNVGGLFEAKKELHKKLITPLKNPDIFKQYKINPIRGVLLYGPPGCGKTLVAGAIFNELNNSLKGKISPEKFAELEKTHFFFVSGPEILSKWVGEGEETIRSLFRAAKEASLDGYPSVIFWDEIDSVARTRQETHAYATEKTIVPTLLSELNGLNTNGNVVLIAATNRPDLLDPALLRAGRLGDLKLEIKRPNKEEALDIVKKYLLPEYRTNNCSYDECVSAVIDTFFNDKILGRIELSDGGEYIITPSDFISGASVSKVIQDVLMESALNEAIGNGAGVSKDLLRAFSEREITEQIKLFKSHNIRDFISLPESVKPISVNILA